jgi:hypothetical protein
MMAPSVELDEGRETIETPAVRIINESHFFGDRDLPNIVTVKRAVVRIYMIPISIYIYSH